MYYSNGRAQEHLERSLYITNAAEPVPATSQHAITDLPWTFRRHPHKWELLEEALLFIQVFICTQEQSKAWEGLSSSLRLRAGSK